MDKDLLKKVSEVYPLKVRNYEQYIDDTDNTSSVEKINAMIQNLHHIGRLTNDVVENWNMVMKWLVSNGIEDITEDYLRVKLDVALNADLRDLTELVTEEKITEVIESGQFEVIVESAINHMHENIQGSLNGFATQLAEKANENALEIERARISNLTANAGNTDGNAELLDIRVGFDGITYDTAGDATRALSNYMAEENESWVI